MHDGDGDHGGMPPPDGIGDAVLAAARAAGIGILVSIVEGDSIRNLWVSERAAEIMHRSTRELLAANGIDFIAPEERPRLRAQREQRLAGEQAPQDFEIVLVGEDGRQIPVSVAISYVQKADQLLTVCFLQDISARKAAADALRASEARFRRLMEDAPDGVVISRSGRVLWANDAAARLLGHDDGTRLVGRSLEEYLDEEGISTMRERILHAIRTGERGTPREYRARRVDGLYVVAEITSHPILYEGEQAVIAFARDVTERAALQAQLARADRLAALGTLAAGVAHEINNPLTFMSLGVDALERTLEKALVAKNDARVPELLHEIRQGASRVAAIVRELSAYSRFDEEARQPLELRDVLASAARLVAHQLRGRIRLTTDIRNPPRVHGNPGRLEQVFVNLLMNAVQALPEDGGDNRVEIVAERLPNGHALIEVRDNGPGIPPEIVHRVFDPFFTTKPPGVGTGLGLSICHRIVAQLGGRITIENAPDNRGTVVRVTLPPATEETTIAGSSARTASKLQRRRLLVVDDEAALVLTVRCLLEQDHDVVTTTNGHEALRRLLEDEPYDLVLCDLAMPGIDGPDLYEAVQKRRPELAERFVFMTGGAFTEKIARFMDRAARPTLQKPFPIAELEALLR